MPEFFDNADIEARVRTKLAPEFTDRPIDVVRIQIEIRRAHRWCVESGFDGYAEQYALSADRSMVGQQLARSSFDDVWSRLFRKKLFQNKLKPWINEQRVMHAVFKEVSAVIENGVD